MRRQAQGKTGPRPSNQTRMQRAAYAAGRLTGRAVRATRNAVRYPEKAMQRIRMLPRLTKPMLARAWRTPLTRKFIATGLVAGAIMSGARGQAKQEFQDLEGDTVSGGIYLDSASVNNGTTLSRAIKERYIPIGIYRRNSAVELTARYLTEYTPVHVYEGIIDEIPVKTLGEIAKAPTLEEQIQILEREIRPEQLDHIQGMMETELLFNPQMQKLTRELDAMRTELERSQSQKNNLITMNFIALALGVAISIAKFRKKRK